MKKTENTEDIYGKRYLVREYTHLTPEMPFLLRFLRDAYRAYGKKRVSVLEIGGGSTIYQLMSAALYSENIVFTDNSDRNLEDVRTWKAKKPGAFNWKKQLKIVSTLEGVSDAVITAKLRRALRTICLLDILNNKPAIRTRFDVVSTHFCAESITDNKAGFERAMRHILSYLKPRGMLVMSMLKNFSSYQDDTYSFRTYSIDETGVRELLERNGFTDVWIESIDLRVNGEQYANMCVRAIRKR